MFFRIIKKEEYEKLKNELNEYREGEIQYRYSLTQMAQKESFQEKEVRKYKKLYLDELERNLRLSKIKIGFADKKYEMYGDYITLAKEKLTEKDIEEAKSLLYEQCISLIAEILKDNFDLICEVDEDFNYDKVKIGWKIALPTMSPDIN